jgi:hypothetical protein
MPNKPQDNAALTEERERLIKENQAALSKAIIFPMTAEEARKCEDMQRRIHELNKLLGKREI